MLGPDSAVRRQLRATRRALSSTESVWERALTRELDAWRAYIESGGGDFPEDYRARLDPSAAIDDPMVLGVLARLPEDTVRILDVGAGPLTSVGKADPDNLARRIEVVAVDPLGEHYGRLLVAAGVSAPVTTRTCRGEELMRVFGAERFDIAHARNAIDHSADPMTVVTNMFEVVRVGGFVILHHYRREAELMGYEQLHQWNFDVEAGRLVLFNRRERYDVAEQLGPRAEVVADVHPGSHHGPWVGATIARTGL